MSDYLTVVFKVDDQEAFQQKKEELLALFVPEGQKLPYSVAAVGIHNEVHRLQLIEEVMQSGLDYYEKCDAVGEIIECMDIDSKTVSDFVVVMD
jgi:hypothetical protein